MLKRFVELRRLIQNAHGKPDEQRPLMSEYMSLGSKWEFLPPDDGLTTHEFFDEPKPLEFIRLKMFQDDGGLDWIAVGVGDAPGGGIMVVLMRDDMPAMLRPMSREEWNSLNQFWFQLRCKAPNKTNIKA